MTTSIVHLDLQAELPDIPPDTIVSRTLVNEPGLRCVLFGFAPGQELTEHTSTMAATLHFLAGTAQVTLGDEVHEVGAGALVYMAPNLRHAIHAQEEVVMLLTMAKGTEK
jgi:quercetin dioxygenase-like cupin family protein